MKYYYQVPKRIFFTVMACLSASLSLALEPVPEDVILENTPESTKAELVESHKPGNMGPTSEPANLLSVGGRFDSSYSGGGAVSQGFAIPSFRVSMFGTAVKHVEYRLSLGQTREFSTATLPQILPVEAYLNILTNPNDEVGVPHLRFRVGMFSPAMNPLWTPDLSEIDMPDYFETHKALFLSRDVGAELLYQPFKERLEIAVGAFNGAGIFMQNTNNGKAFTGYLKWMQPLGQDWKVSVGTGNYVFNQSTVGSVNYKASGGSDVFLSVEYLPLHTMLSVDAFNTHFEDSTRSLSPSGGAGALTVGLASWLRIFGRVENANASPLLAGAIRHYQFGPEFIVNENLKSFLTYQQLESGGSVEKIVLIRIRLTV